MKVIKKIKVLSIAKIFAIVTGGLYLAVVLVVIVFGSVIVGDSSMISSVRGFGRFDFLVAGGQVKISHIPRNRDSRPSNFIVRIHPPL